MNGAGPWWYSGPSPDDQPAGAGDRKPNVAFTLASLASGAQQVVDMAKQVILVPHADHDDPSEHGSCIICRGLLVLGDVRVRPEDDDGGQRRADESPATVRWVDLDPVRPDAGEPDADHRLWP